MQNKVVLVIAAHPDDEVLGCGGTIAKHCNNGDEVHVVILAEGITSRNDWNFAANSASQLNQLYQETHSANHYLGVKSVSFCRYPDNRMDTVPLLDITKKIEEFILHLKPNIVYTHSSGDINIDHRIAHEATITACRPVNSNSVKRLLFFEVLSSTEWSVPGNKPAYQPTWFVDISDTLNYKIEAMRLYQTELRDWPHPRSLKAIENLAFLRGSTIGVNAAESFILGRNIC